MDLRPSDISFETSYKQPIGVFDSGVGGLTILTEIKKLLPNENLLYLGDSARSPYGTKSAEKIKSMSLENSLFLSNSGSKVIVIACNTATAVAQDFVESMLGKKVIGVIDAGVRAALISSSNKKIGIIGTTQTIKSRAHELAIKKIDPSVKVFAKPTPIFATIVEEGFVDNKSTEMLIEEELNYFKECGVDTLILGCTHYPFLKEKINSFFDGTVNLIDPA
jgi:glutamate racemase